MTALISLVTRQQCTPGQARNGQRMGISALRNAAITADAFPLVPYRAHTGGSQNRRMVCAR